MYTASPQSRSARGSSLGLSRSRQSKRYQPSLSLLEDRYLLAVTFTTVGVSTDTGNIVSAEAIFDKLPGDILQVVLINTSPNPQSIRRGDTLTGVLWDIDGAKPTLLPAAPVAVTPGSTVYTRADQSGPPSIPSTSWDFKGAPGGPYTYPNGAATFQYGFSAVGGGVFQGVQGDDYGLIADASSLSNPSFSSSAFPLIVNSVTFQLSGFTADLSQLDSVKFTYGSEPNFVLPTTDDIDLGLAKSVSNPRPNVGDTVSFTVSVSNPGPGNATGVVVTDALPAGLAYVSSAATAGSYDPDTDNWVVGSVAAGRTETLTISAVVTGCDPTVNTARIIATGQPDPNPANDSASVAVTPLNADLQLTKTVDNDRPMVGQDATFTVTLTNAGPDPASEVVVSDLLPAGLSLQSATPSVGSTFDPVTGRWAVGTLPQGGSATLALRVAAAAGGTYTNIAFVSDTATADCNPGNESAQSTITVATPPPPAPVDLSLLKTVANSRPNAGDSITFTLTVSNPSSLAVDRVAVQDVIPPNLAVEGVTVTQGSVSTRFSTWLVGTIAPNSTATLTLVGRVVGCDPFVNSARIIAAGLPDPDPSNNTSSVTITPLQADLEVTKTASNSIPIVGRLYSFPIVGRPFSFTVTLTNKGPDPAEGVVLTDQLPASLTLVNSSPSRGIYDAATGLWTVGTLAPGETVTLNLTVQATAPGLIANLASVTGTNTCDPTSANDASVVRVLAIDPAVLAPCVINLERFGYHHQPTALVLTFNRQLDPARAADVANYRLVALFHHGRLRVDVPIAKAMYDSTQDTVSLTPKYHGRPFLPLHNSYELTVVGSGGSGITSAIGIPLDGRCNQTPGTDYVRRFGFEVLSGTNRPGAPRKAFDRVPRALAGRLGSGASLHRAALPAGSGLAVALHRSRAISR